jgi:RHS repeat-associated protein
VGEIRVRGTIPTDKLFTGQRLDATGLYYYNARYYDATIGRFISADTIIPYPSDPQSFNRYSYCRNNPLKYTDPTGNLDSDYMVLMQYLENQSAVNTVLNQLPPGYAFGFAFITGATPYQVLPSNLTNILDNATGGGGGTITLPLAETQTQGNQELKDIKENPGQFFSGLFKASLGVGLMGGGIVFAVFGAETIIGIGVGGGFVVVGYSFMAQGVNEASYGRAEWPEIPFLDEIIRTAFDYLKDWPLIW